MAGINAALRVKEKEPFILTRSEGYIGVLIDDLVTKGTNEPYRMLTSRAEYRLILRQDNADLRLTAYGRRVGLVDDTRWKIFDQKRAIINEMLDTLKNTKIPPKNPTLKNLLDQMGSKEIKTSISLYELLKRPEITYADIAELTDKNHSAGNQEEEQVEIQVKYEGYIKKQLEQVERFNKLEHRHIPEDIDYHMIKGLRMEARQKLNKIKPASLGQASRISGVSPADISVLLIYLEQRRRILQREEK